MRTQVVHRAHSASSRAGLWLLACLFAILAFQDARADTPDYCHFPSNSIDLPAKYRNPRMMAIGDSIYNGVRALSINAKLARLSVPSLVAAALHEPFIPAQYPMPVITDLERAVASPQGLVLAVSRMKQNIRAWLFGPPAYRGDLLFDNIAIAGGRVEDLLDRTWQSTDRELRDLKIDPNGSLFDMPIGKLFFDLNARFLLDPTKRPDKPQTPDFSGLTPLAQVALRKPKRLLVNIGNNHGLWKLAFEAADEPDQMDTRDPPNTPLVPATQALGVGFPKLMEQLAACLAALPPEVEHIYFNTLIHPSAIANLMPVDKHARLDGNYYGQYYNYLGSGFAEVPGGTVRGWDQLVDDVNARVQKILTDAFASVGKPGRLTIVDINALVQNYDVKRPQVGIGRPAILGGYALTNWPLEGYPAFPHAGGGIFSADNMHLSTVGYSLMATHVLASIAGTEGGRAQVVDYNALYRNDHNGVFPGLSQLSWANQIFRDFRAAKAGYQSAPERTTRSSASFAAVKGVFEILSDVGVIP